MPVALTCTSSPEQPYGSSTTHEPLSMHQPQPNAMHAAHDVCTRHAVPTTTRPAHSYPGDTIESVRHSVMLGWRARQLRSSTSGSEGDCETALAYVPPLSATPLLPITLLGSSAALHHQSSLSSGGLRRPQLLLG